MIESGDRRDLVELARAVFIAVKITAGGALVIRVVAVRRAGGGDRRVLRHRVSAGGRDLEIVQVDQIGSVVNQEVGLAAVLAAGGVDLRDRSGDAQRDADSEGLFAGRGVEILVLEVVRLEHDGGAVVVRLGELGLLVQRAVRTGIVRGLDRKGSHGPTIGGRERKAVVLQLVELLPDETVEPACACDGAFAARLGKISVVVDRAGHDDGVDLGLRIGRSRGRCGRESAELQRHDQRQQQAEQDLGSPFHVFHLY